MKKLIGLLSGLLLLIFSSNAQILSKSGKATGFDKSVIPVVQKGDDKKLNLLGKNNSPDKYTVNPKKVLTLTDGRKLTVELNRTPTTGGATIINKINNGELPKEHQGGWTTDVKKVYLTAESTTFMNASNNNMVNIVPGAIYNFEEFIGGSNNEILGNRNPIRIYTDNALKPGAVGGIVVNNPTAYDILQGNSGANLNVIKNSITESVSGIKILQASYTANSEAELALKVTAGGSYAGFTGSGGYKLTQNQNHFFLTVDAIKPMYTIKAERPQNGFFTTANGVLNKVYIKEVNYGSRILANVEIVLENREDIINFKANYEGAFKADLGTDFINKTKNKNEKVNAYVIGVPGNVSTFSKDNLEAEIKALLATCTFQYALPYSYTLGDMDGNTVATHSATDEIIERNSVPDNLVYRLQEATLVINTGDDNKESQSRVAMELYSGNGDNGSLLMYQPLDNSKMDFAKNSEMSFGLTANPNINSDELLLDNIKSAGGLRVRLYYYANWATDAWKIESVSLKLKFFDQFGNVYVTTKNSTPLDGSRPFFCLNAKGTLDGFERKAMECYFNNNFSPIGSAIKK